MLHVFQQQQEQQQDNDRYHNHLEPDIKHAEQSWHAVTPVGILDAQHFRKSGS